MIYKNRFRYDNEIFVAINGILIASNIFLKRVVEKQTKLLFGLSQLSFNLSFLFIIVASCPKIRSIIGKVFLKLTWPWKSQANIAQKCREVFEYFFQSKIYKKKLLIERKTLLEPGNSDMHQYCCGSPADPVFSS